jgi:hypothetical protein
VTRVLAVIGVLSMMLLVAGINLLRSAARALGLR